MGKTIGLMVYWFGLMVYPTGFETTPMFRNARHHNQKSYYILEGNACNITSCLKFLLL